MKYVGRLAPSNLGALSDPEAIDRVRRLDAAGFYALDLWGAEDFGCILNGSGEDPWERLRTVRRCLGKTKLQLLLRGQSLLGTRIYPDDVTGFFIARAIDNGIDIIRVYDALNDPRNLEIPIKTAKKYGAELHAALVYTVSPAHSVSFFAGYAALLEQMGADSVCIFDPSGLLRPDETAELIGALKRSVSVPIAVSTASVRENEISAAASKAGADIADRRIFPGLDLVSSDGASADTEQNTVDELLHNNSALADETSRVQADAGYPALAEPIAEIIKGQAKLNLKTGKRYGDVLPEFRALLCGRYGRTPAPVSEIFASKLVGDEPMLLTRPADVLASELDEFRTEIARYTEQAEDILTYAISGSEAIRFFEHRKARRYGLDAPHADQELGVHII